jgi:hypothetical protein
MKVERDHRHYVPVVRFRRGEKVAMRQLRDDTRFRMTPLIELVPTTDYTPLTVGDEIRTHWGPHPYFFDIHHLPEGEDPSFMLKVDQAMRNHGLASVPVVQLINGVKLREAVAHIVAQNGRGACLRLFPEDLRSPSMSNDITGLLNHLRLRPEKVDLVVDYRIISQFNPPFSRLCSRLPALEKWRTFTVVSGAFSKDLTDFEKNRQHTWSRDDWTSWKRQVTEEDLPRYPSYGDYTVQYPLLVQPPEFPNISASIRYTAEDCWVIMRGEGMKTGPGSIQYAANAQLLVERPEFCGASFSAGDQYIYDLSRYRTKGTGSPETLIRAAINHHVTMVLDQIAKLFVISAGDEPGAGLFLSQQRPRVERKSPRELYAGPRPRHQTPPRD